MNRKILFSVVCFLVFGLFLTGGAMGALVASKYVPPLEPGLPQIMLADTTTAGYFQYNETDNTFDMASQAITIIIPSAPRPFYTLTGVGYSTSAAVNIDLDNGTLQGGIYVGNLGTFTIQVASGSVNIWGNNYNAGTTLLSGTVWAFGFYDQDSGKTAIFDFQLKDLGGALVNDGFWPSSPNTTSYLYAWSENSWPGNFDDSFTVEKSKGKVGPTDSPPVPVPATLILLGSGLSVFGFLRVRAKNKR